MNETPDTARTRITISSMGTVLLFLQQRVFKIPRSFAGYRECIREKKNIFLAKNDTTYKKFLPHYVFWGPIIISERLKPTTNEQSLNTMFQELLVGSEGWQARPLQELVEGAQLETFFQQQLSTEDHHYWSATLSSLTVPTASAHGDFYIKNILEKNGQLYCIDWTNYTARGCRYFDLLDFFIIQDGISWTTRVSSLLSNHDLRTILTDRLTPSLIVSYCLWKVGKELRELTTFGRKNAGGVKKYLTLLDVLKNLPLQK